MRNAQFHGAETFLSDLRYGIRLLRRNPLFALTAALSLSIGIGATTTVFTVANGLLFRAPSGVGSPETLVDISHTQDGRTLVNPTSFYRNYKHIRQTVTTVGDLYGYQLDAAAVSLKLPGSSSAERTFVAAVTANYFSALAVPPAVGQVFAGSESDDAGAAPVAVLSHRFWKRRFDGNPSIVGQALRLNGQTFTVIGVTKEGFLGMGVITPDIWVPIATSPAINREMVTDWFKLMIGGRLRDGVSLGQAAAEIDGIGRSLETLDPIRNRGFGLRLVAASPIPGNLRAAAGAFFVLLMALVSLVLVITCVNLAGVLLARSTARRREIAMRLAMGAGRGRLIRQLLTETALLFLLGGAAGLWLARALTSLLLSRLSVFPLPVDFSLPLDGRVVAFVTVVSLVSAVLCGLAPALQGSKADLVSALKNDAEGLSERSRLRSAFVIAQVAFSTLLVVSAGLLVNTLGHVAYSDRGFDPRGVETASIDLAMAGYTDSSGPIFLRELSDRLSALPGVEVSTLADRVPTPTMTVNIMRDQGLSVPGVAPPGGGSLFNVNWTSVAPGYFSTMRMSIVSGREFTPSDGSDGQRVAIVSQSTARLLWPGQDPVGKIVQWHAGLVQPTQTMRVIGVARDLKSDGARGPMVLLTMYAPLQQRYSPRVTILARSTRSQRLTGELRALLASMDPNLVVLDAQTLEQQLVGPVEFQLRVSAAVSGALGVIGLLLATIGIYGVTAYAVSRRTREIGIRLAIGANRADVLGMVMRQGMTLVICGSTIGLILGAGVGRILAGSMFRMAPFDPLIFGGAALLFTLIGVAACGLPALRATRIDAMKALRYE